MNVVANETLATVDIARVCHQANKAYCELQGDNSQPHWEDAADWQRLSMLQGVEFRLSNPGMPVSAQHDNWMRQKLSEGWVYGREKSIEKKTHPCLVAFESLPESLQKKDRLFQAIVDALA